MTYYTNSSCYISSLGIRVHGPGCPHDYPGTAPPVVRHLARRGDDVEAWLKGWLTRMRSWERAHPETLIGDMLEDYRQHADAGTPLDAEVRER